MHKFLSIDPLNGSFPMLTPYQFASNNPIQNIDLDGEEGVKVTDHKSKTITVIVEIDYAYVKGQPLENVSHIQNINQIDRIQKNLNKELNKHHYKDRVTGYDVQFSVIFNAITGTVANSEINGNMNIQDPRMVLQMMETESHEVAGPDKDMVYKATKEGESSWRLLRLTSSRNGHTIAHELFHLLTHKHENAPADIKTQIDWTNQTPGHNQAGGIFQYADDRTGLKEEDISQDNIQSVLHSLPERTPPPPVCIPDPTDK